MKTSNKNRNRKFIYNEPKLTVPNHQFPESQKFDINANSGIKARILIEKALQSFEGVNTSKLKELEISSKDLINFRKEIKNALYAIIKEENGYDLRLRSGAIAYLGALKYNEAADLVASIALCTNENNYVRGYAIEALSRIKVSSTEQVLEQLIYDPVFTVREKAIRVLGLIGTTNHIPLLKIISKDKDSEIEYRAKAALHWIETGKKLKRLDNKSNQEIGKTVSVSGVQKPVGRHGLQKPQTTYGNHEVGGGMNLVAKREIEKEEAEKPTRPIVYEIMPNTLKDITRLILRGDGVGNSMHLQNFAKTYHIHEDELILEFSLKNKPSLGCSLGLFLTNDRFAYQINNWLPDAPDSPVIYSINSDESVIWSNEKFGLKVKFYAPDSEKIALLKLQIKMPKDNYKEIQIVINQSELASGEKIIPNFLADLPGNIRINAALYTQNGGACKFETKLSALPSNPISMNVSPSRMSGIGEGPAHYNSIENKFYCYAQLEVNNGFPHSVTLGPRVTAKVSDGGVAKDNFSFNISTLSVPANSTRTISIWMSFGGGTYNVFKEYGDVTIRLTLQTSEGDIADAGVWAAMAQIKLALNFVGNFSSTTRDLLQSVVDNEASSIYEQQNFFISESAQFLLPSSNSDFNRYRDIEMEDNKDSDCTSGSDEADDLRDDWSSPNDSWLDVWCVETLSGPSCAASVGGFSPVDGPTGKGGSNSGVIIKMSAADLTTSRGRNLMGIIIAHEVGHFLGLNHHGTAANFMAASTSGNNTDITHQQYINMTDHDFVSRFVI